MTIGMPPSIRMPPHRRAWPERILRTIAAAILAVGICAAVARADADPASDILIGARVFYPYSPAVSTNLQTALNAEVEAAARAHFPIKVALIGTPLDLGALASLFDKPQPYADLLDQELTFASSRPPPLLVVMADGYGVKNLPAPATAAALSLTKPAHKRNDDLARAAIVAVRKLAAAAGHPIPRIPISGGTTGNDSNTLAAVAVAVAAIAAAATIIGMRRRLARRR
jgi:hypothetical protein